MNPVFAECGEAQGVCERGELWPVCVPGRVCVGVHRGGVPALAPAAGPAGVGHAPHHGLHLRLQRGAHLALGPSTQTHSLFCLSDESIVNSRVMCRLVCYTLDFFPELYKMFRHRGYRVYSGDI